MALPAGRKKDARSARFRRDRHGFARADASRLCARHDPWAWQFWFSQCRLADCRHRGWPAVCHCADKGPEPFDPACEVRDQALNASLAMNLIVATVMMATLVVAPFYLSRALGLDAAMVGLVLSTGPLITALAALPAGRLVDRFGANRIMIVGLFDLAIGTFALSRAEFGIAGYVVPIIIVCTGYSLFQTSNNSAVMTGVAPDQRGVVSGLLNLSRNLGLITGASVMGAVFAFASAGEGTGLAVLAPAAAARGMQVTFQVATGLVLMALILAVFSARATAGRTDIVAKHP
ncbi:MFS transporter [Mesorhizobium sp. M1233]